MPANIEEGLFRQPPHVTSGEEAPRSGSFVWHPRDDSVSWSSNAAAIAGFAPEAGPDRLTDAMVTVVHKEELQRVLGEIRAWIHTRRPCDVEFRVVRPNGETRALVASGHGIFDDSGELGQFIGALFDITERRRAENGRSHVDAALTHERAKLRELVSLLATTEDRERQRLAALLHDEVTQLLATCRIKLESLAADVGEPHAAAFDELRAMHDRALEVTRALTVELSPPVLQLGLAPALAWLADHFETRRGISVSFTSTVAETGLPPQTEVLLFVATRELIHNVRKHAGPAATIRIELSRKGSDILLTVEDDGIGMNSEVTLANTSGYGLFSIRQRMEPLGGHVMVESQPGRGTLVTITCPV